jgi:multisubunit Na+/H+ antiporter MnhC subunit
MNSEIVQNLRYFEIGIILTAFCGLYCIIATRNFMKVVVGVSILFEAVKLLIILAGYANGHTALAQALVINVIVVEAVVVSVMLCLVIRIYHHNQSLDVKKLRNLKG